MHLLSTALLFFCIGTASAFADLATAIENVRITCGNISDELTDMKKIAGINTAVTGVGTVAGGVALGTGIAKTKVDKELSETDELIAALEAAGAVRVTSLEMLYSTIADAFIETGNPQALEFAAQLKARKNKLTQKSQKLGNVRTGTLAASTATNLAGAVISGVNQVKGDLKTQINECLTSIKTLADVYMQARISQTAADADLTYASNIISACGAWDTVDMESINKRATGATVSSSIGAGLGLAGTITSATANSKAVRESENTNKEKRMNTAANVLAGGTAAASGAATIFNATQISAIKRAAAVADECEEALK